MLQKVKAGELHKGVLDFYLWPWKITPNKNSRVFMQNDMHIGYGKKRKKKKTLPVESS